MKLDKKAIKEFARRTMQYDTHDPFEATLRALETWMGKNNVKLVKLNPPETGEALSSEGKAD